MVGVEIRLSLCGLKTVLTILVMVGMLGQTFSKLFVIIDFRVNRNYIAKTLCENRNKPQMHCNGQCVFMKKLKQEEKKDEENPNRRADNQFEAIAENFEPFHLKSIDFISLVRNVKPSDRIISPFDYPPFHPPQA
jgi:hypothetical protein